MDSYTPLFRQLELISNQYGPNRLSSVVVYRQRIQPNERKKKKERQDDGIGIGEEEEEKKEKL